MPCGNKGLVCVCECVLQARIGCQLSEFGYVVLVSKLPMLSYSVLSHHSRLVMHVCRYARASQALEQTESAGTSYSLATLKTQVRSLVKKIAL